MRQKLAKLVLDWGNGFGLKLWPPTSELFQPETSNDGIGDVLDHLLAESPIAENFADRFQRCSAVFDRCQQGMPPNMFHSRAPTVAVEFLKGSQDARYDKGPILNAMAVEWIEGDRMHLIASIEQNNIVCAVTGYGRRDCFRQVAVRINQSHSSTQLDVGRYQSLDQRRLSHSRLSDHSQMATAVIEPDAKRFTPASISQTGKHGGGRVRLWQRNTEWRFQLSKGTRRQFLDANCSHWRMPECRDLSGQH